MPITPVRLIVIALVLLGAPAAEAASVKAGTLEIFGAWADAQPLNAKAGAAYLSIRNTGPNADTLIGVESPLASRAMLLATTIDGGMTQSHRLARLSVGPGRIVALEPGGYHIVLSGLYRPMAAGTSFTLILRFAGAGIVRVPVEVR